MEARKITIHMLHEARESSLSAAKDAVVGTNEAA
jgi:hypothetical protein